MLPERRRGGGQLTHQSHGHAMTVPSFLSPFFLFLLNYLLTSFEIIPSWKKFQKLPGTSNLQSAFIVLTFHFFSCPFPSKSSCLLSLSSHHPPPFPLLSPPHPSLSFPSPPLLSTIFPLFSPLTSPFSCSLISQLSNFV